MSQKSLRVLRLKHLQIHIKLYRRKCLPPHSLVVFSLIEMAASPERVAHRHPAFIATVTSLCFPA